jgi:uncharacterized protein YlzI (FlbEa/FlbD family)
VNKVPIANAGTDQTIDENSICTLNGKGSSDADGDSLRYLWTAPAGIVLSSTIVASPTFTAPEVTTDTNYIFSLVVNDGTLNSFSDDVVIKIKQINKMPVANAGIDQTVNENSVCTLDGLGSFDPDKDLLTYLWIAPDGILLNSNAAANPVFTVPEVVKDTVFNFSLVVNDGISSSEPSSVRVFVLNVINTPAEILNLDVLKIYPNPSNGIFFIHGLEANQNNNIEIYSTEGKLISKIISNSVIEKIDISAQMPETYILLINGKQFKIIKYNNQ